MNIYILLIIICIIILVLKLVPYLDLQQFLSYFIILNTSSMLGQTVENDLMCGQGACKKCTNLSCEQEILQLSEPIIPDLTKWNKNMHLYIANMLNIIFLDKSDVISGLLYRGSVYKESYTYPFGQLYTSRSTLNSDTLYILFRGSSFISEWYEDLRIAQQSLPFNTNSINNYALVHKGFVEVYLSIRKELLDIVNVIKPKKIILGGHSLGAAVATLCALDLYLNNYKDLVVYNIAPPRIGDMLFSTYINKIIPVFNLINSCDVIPTLPNAVSTPLMGDNIVFYQQTGKTILFSDNWKSLTNNHLFNCYIHNLKKIPSSYSPF